MYKIFEKLLKEKNLSPYRVAKETGIPVSTFTEWKKGTYKPKVDKLIKIANYLGVPFEVFFKEETDGGQEKEA